MRLRFALLLALLPLGVRAQTPGSCLPGRAERDLDIGDVLARVYTTGSLFFGNTSEAAYLVPRASGRSAVYAADIWVGGYVGDELRVAAATYADWEYWPGPLLPGATLPDAADCSSYDRIWKVSRYDVEGYYRTGEATPDLREWPFDLGAPVLDGDGDPANYDIEGGDQPAIYGDQTLWWVMNDVGNTHDNSHTPPIGLEVQVTAFGFADGPPALRQATFYRYRLVNRSAEPLDSAYVAFWIDTDLGDAADDHVGTDTTLGMGFVYNADNTDGTGGGTSYGTPPPAAGVLFFDTPVGLPNGRDDDHDGSADEAGERLGLTAASCWAKSSPYPLNDPNDGPEIYNCMQGRWKDGTPMTVGGIGYPPNGPVTTIQFPGDPVTRAFWSEMRPLPTGPTVNPSGDKRMVLASGPFRFEPGEVEELVVAIVFAQGADHLDSVTQLRRAAAIVRNAYDAGYLDPRLVPGFELPPLPAGVELHRPAPNPFTEAAVIRYALPAGARVRIALVDVLGREVAVLTDGPREAGPHEVTVDGRALAPGVYVARVWVDGQAVAALPLTRR